MRRAARVDQGQDQIVSAMRAAGATVWIIGLPVDLLVGYAGRTALVEVKRDSKAKFTKLQTEFMANWKGGTLARIDNPEAALRLLKVMEGGE